MLVEFTQVDGDPVYIATTKVTRVRPNGNGTVSISFAKEYYVAVQESLETVVERINHALTTA